MLDLLSHMIVQGEFTQQDLQTRFESEGPFNLTTLVNQTIEVGYDSSEGKVTIDGALVIFGDMQGVDGHLHFITELPLPRSVTHTVYDIAKEDPNFSTQISYIDYLQLDGDMKRLLPLTTFYVPNPEWEGVVTKIEEIAKTVLESHIFETLLWCDTLRDMVGNGTSATSYNNETWTLSINQDGFPCFDTYGKADGQMRKACISKCDIIARNGIVHELDTLLLFDAADTRPPSQFVDNVPRPPSAPSPPTVFQRPSDSSLTADDAPVKAPSSKIGFGGDQSGALLATLSGATLIVSIASTLIQLLN
jgi:ethanolamine utilization microcompartment shell protein EutS